MCTVLLPPGVNPIAVLYIYTVYIVRRPIELFVFFVRVYLLSQHVNKYGLNLTEIFLWPKTLLVFNDILYSSAKYPDVTDLSDRFMGTSLILTENYRSREMRLYLYFTCGSFSLPRVKRLVF
jgi:hypothetical protein